MLVGREEECSRLEALVDTARGGTSGALVLRGEAGVGKTALLQHAAAYGRNMWVLQATGIEGESEIAYATLSDLLPPVLDFLDDIPAPQGAALRGAFALAPASATERFAAAAGTLSLLAAAAEEKPVLAVVDDAQWLDSASAEALAFAARRLEHEGVVLLFGLRHEEPSAFDPAGLSELTVRGLDAPEARALLARTAEVGDGVADRLIETTHGNPLALLEIAGMLTPAERAGIEPLMDPVTPGAGLRRAFGARLEALREDARAMLVLAAAAHSGEAGPVLRAATAAGLDPAALEQAEAAELLRIEGRQLEWRHPLVRSVVYHGAPARERREAHLALAEALKEEPERRAWHLAAATFGPSEEVAAALEDVAGTARRRGGRSAAARAFARAAALTPREEERARRLLEAARDSYLVGRLPEALEQLDEALAATGDPLLRADIQHLRGEVQMWDEGPTGAGELLRTEAARVESSDADRAALMLASAAITGSMSGDVAAMLATAREAMRVAARASPRAQEIAEAVLSNALILAGEAPEAYPLLDRCRRRLQGPGLPTPELVQSAAHGSIWVGDHDEAQALLTGVVAAARSASAAGLLSFPLSLLAQVDFRTGRWAAATAEATEAIRLANESGQDSLAAFGRICLAYVEAARGREAECRGLVAQASERARACGTESLLTYATSIMGLLELGLGRPEEAIEHLETTATRVEAHGVREPGVVQWHPDLIEAYVLVGRDEEAREVLADFERQARHNGRAWALAAAARGRGMLAEEDAFDAAFAEALQESDPPQSPFERARTQLRFGERLRRAKRLSEAKAPLRSALETFERLGAAPWAQRARTELAAAGERRRRRRASGLEDLTSQELQIALAAGAGATNREAAAALFLSPKTVEFHLGKVYRKLGIRSRTELARVVGRDGQVDAARTTVPRVDDGKATENVAMEGGIAIIIGEWLRDASFALTSPESVLPIMGLLDDLASLA